MSAHKPKVVVLDQAFGNVDHERAMAKEWGAHFAEHQCTTESETIDASRGATVVFVNFAPVTDAVLAALAPGATVIRYGVGYDNVDVAAAARRGIRVANVPDYGIETVADHTLALLLSCLRRVTEYTSAIKADGWIPPGGLGAIKGFRQTTVALVGTGRIGTEVARRLQPFGFEVLAFDPYADRSLSHNWTWVDDLDELFRRADCISLHCPLTPATRHLVDAAAIRKMREGVVIVNTSRGGLIDTGALEEGLRLRVIGGAALDVHEVEPLPPGSELRTFENVLLTPHTAFYSTASLDALQRLAAEEAGRALRGDPLRSPVVP